jgi:hypothetical protein
MYRGKVAGRDTKVILYSWQNINPAITLQIYHAMTPPISPAQAGKTSTSGSSAIAKRRAFAKHSVEAGCLPGTQRIATALVILQEGQGDFQCSYQHDRR